MTIDEAYNSLTEALRVSNNLDIIEELETLLYSAATGGEGVALVGEYLRNLSKKHPEIYKTNSELIGDFLKVTNGYF